MLLAKLPYILSLLWALLAAVVWWGRLQSPVLFLTVALLAGLGTQTVSAVLWAMWQAARYNQFFVPSAGATQASIFYATAFQAIATFCMVAPIYWLLSKRL